MAMKVFNVGDVLAAADVNEYLVNTILVQKPSDTSRNTTTTLANDPDLTVAVAANKTYWCEVLVQYLASGTFNLKAAFTMPAGAAFNGEMISMPAGGGSFAPNGLDAANPLNSVTFHIAGGGAFELTARLSGLLVVAGSSGSLTLQWAQDTSGATNTTVRAGSFMYLRRAA